MTTPVLDSLAINGEKWLRNAGAVLRPPTVPAQGVGIPAPLADGSLPRGVWTAPAEEFVARFGGAPFSTRTVNIDALGDMVERIHPLGVETIVVGGSTVLDPSVAPDPHDLNAAFERTRGTNVREVRRAIRLADHLTGAASMDLDGVRAALMVQGEDVRGLVTMVEAGKFGTVRGGRELVSHLDLLGRTQAGIGTGLVRMYADDLVRLLR